VIRILGRSISWRILASKSVWIPVAILFLLSTSPLSSWGQEHPAVAYGAENWLVVWYGDHAGSDSVYGMRVAQDGELLDAAAFLIHPGGYRAYPDVAFDGENWGVVARRSVEGGLYAIDFARVSQDGDILDPPSTEICTGSVGSQSVSFGDSCYLVVWHDWLLDEIRASRVAPSGIVLDPLGFTVCTGGQSPDIAFDGTNWLVVWLDTRNGTSNTDIYGALISPSGAVLGLGEIPICTSSGRQLSPSVSYGAGHYLVVWNDERMGSWDSYGAFVSTCGGVDPAAGFCISDYYHSPSTCFGLDNWLTVMERPHSTFVTPRIHAHLVEPTSLVVPLDVDYLGLGGGWAPFSIAYGETGWLAVWCSGTNWSSNPPNIVGRIVGESGELMAAVNPSKFLGCRTLLHSQGTTDIIGSVPVGEPFDIRFEARAMGNQPESVRFMSDESQDGSTQGDWTDWYEWTSATEEMTHSWSFATRGQKEVWAEVRFASQTTCRSSANIEATDSVVVSFPDPGLEAAIRDAISKPTGDIYDSDLVGLTQLDASHRAISDLTGLEHSVNLQELYLWDNIIGDISALIDLDKLRKLQIDHNQISDVSPLGALTNLEWLNLENNQIYDITSLGGLTKLLFLELWQNQISDISLLSNLKNLQILSIGGNQISNILALIGLTSLQKLYLSFNQISDISPLLANSGLASGDHVDLRYNYLDLTPGSDEMQNIQVLINRGVDVDYEPQDSPENHPPIAQASDISSQPRIMYPDTVYSATAKYYDPDGRDDLKACYLRLDQPSGGKDLTMMWYQDDGQWTLYAGEEGETYLTITDVNPTEITNAAGNEGYELTWSFQLSDQWPEAESSIDFGVFASDDNDLTSDWDYDETNASFVGTISGSVQPHVSVPVYSPVESWAHEGATITQAITVLNDGPAAGTVTLSATDVLGWTVGIEPQSVDLQPGASEDVKLSVSFHGSNAANVVTVSGLVEVEGEQPRVSSCTVEFVSQVGADLFLARLTFSSSTEQALHLSAQDAGGEDARSYVKLSSTGLVLGPSSSEGFIRALFDPKKDDTSRRGYTLVVSKGGTSESGKLSYDFPLDADGLLATNFDIATDSFSFPNWGDGYCFGMSESSILYFEDKLTRPGGATETYELGKLIAQPVIQDHQNRKLGRFADWDWWPWTKPNDWYEEVKAGIEEGLPMVLITAQQDGQTHAVVAYRIASRGTRHYVFVYENESIYHSLLGSGFPYAVYDEDDEDGESFTYGGDVVGIWKAKRLPSEWTDDLLDNTLDDNLRVFFQCPVHITITDPYGRAISNTGVNDIPGATVTIDETITFSLPPGVAYSIDINAYEAGFFSMAIMQPPEAADDSMQIAIFDCIATLETTKATVYLPERFGNPVLRIDQDGDGVIDEECFPDFSTHGASVPVSESVNHGPNPVPAEGCIFWLDLPDDTVDATLKVLDIDGALLVSIPLDPMADWYPAAGRWLPEDDQGRLLGTGLYLYVVEIEHIDGTITYSPVQKMVIQR